MGELILCGQPMAGVPYYLEDISINVYSLEELSYYIQQQAELLDASFADPDLCSWIRQELGMKTLAGILHDDLDQHQPLHVFVDHLLNACGYLTRAEIRQTVEIIAGFENMTEAEVKKQRADRLAAKGRLVDAVYAYENLIDRRLAMSQSLEGNLYHNLGNAYAKLFFFRRASGCFEAAYRCNRNPASLMSLLTVCLLDENEEEFSHMCHRYQVLPEMVEQVKENLQKTYQDDQNRNFEEAIAHMKHDYPDKDEYRRHLISIVTRWEGDYIKLCKM